MTPLGELAWNIHCWHAWKMWHTWFAWHPVWINGKMIWWKNVDRICHWRGVPEYRYYWEYRYFDHSKHERIRKEQWDVIARQTHPLIKEREEYRKNKEFEKAEAIREQLKKMGVCVWDLKDNKTAFSWTADKRFISSSVQEDLKGVPDGRITAIKKWLFGSNKKENQTISVV